MTTAQQVQPGLVLTGLDGANPLAFLAALGTLRGLTIAWSERSVRLSWRRLDAWRPVVHVDGLALTPDLVLDGLDRFFQMRPGHEALEIDDNLKVSTKNFRLHAQQAAQSAWLSGERRARSDLIAAFASDMIAKEDVDEVQPTALRIANGAGHQDFLKGMRVLAALSLNDSIVKVNRGRPADDRTDGKNTKLTCREALVECLFTGWTRAHVTKSLRWDPVDLRLYALRWKSPTAPGEEPTTEWGANRLAFEALPLFPVVPVGKKAITTGFSRLARDTVWTWPMWKYEATLDTARSLLSLALLQKPVLGADDQSALAGIGVPQVFRCKHLSGDKGRLSLSPARPV